MYEAVQNTYFVKHKKSLYDEDADQMSSVKRAGINPVIRHWSEEEHVH